MTADRPMEGLRVRRCFDTISHELLLELVERRVGDVKVVRLIRAWLKAGVMEEGRVTHPDRGSPQGVPKYPGSGARGGPIVSQ